MLIISTSFTVVSPYIGTKLLYDNVLTPGVDTNLFGEVGLVIGIIIFARILSLLINIGQNYIVGGIIPWVVYDLKVRIFTAMQKLSVGFYTSKQTGSLMTRVNRDANNIYWFFVDGAPSVVVNVLMFIGVLSIMIYMNWQLSVIVVVMIPLLLFLYKIIQKSFRKLHHARWINEANMSSYISDSMSGQRIIKAFAKGITSALKELLGDNTPFPEFRKLWLDSTRDIAEAYTAGAIDKNEMKRRYEERKAKHIQLLVALMLRDCPEQTTPLRNIIMKRLAA
jgi:ABC-type multidrug transport system fused ATPase/permease subunit